MKLSKPLCCVGLMIGMSISMLLQTQLSTAMPIISAEFDTIFLYSWVYSGYMLASSITIPFFGRICERYGCRQNYVVGAVIFFVGTLGSAVSPNMVVLVLFRVLTGIGSGIVIPATYGIINTLFERRHMRKVYGMIAVFQMVNKGLGSVLGGIFSTHFSWRYGLLILVPIELVGALLVFFTAKAHQPMRSDSPINLRSAVLLSAALLVTMLGLEWASDTLTAFNGLVLLSGIVLLILFVMREHKTGDGILPAAVIKSAPLKGLLLEVLLLGAVMNVCFAYLPTYMTQVFGWSTSRAGIVLLICIVAMGISSMAAAFLKTESNPLLTTSWLVFTLAAACGMVSYYSHVMAVFYLSNVLMGIGMGVLGSVALGAIQQLSEESSASTNGIAHLLRNIGGTLGVTAFQFSMTQGMWILFPGMLLLGLIALAVQNIFVKKAKGV